MNYEDILIRPVVSEKASMLLALMLQRHRLKKLLHACLR